MMNYSKLGATAFALSTLLCSAIDMAAQSLPHFTRNSFPGQGFYDFNQSNDPAVSGIEDYAFGAGWDHCENARDLAISSLDSNLVAFVDNETSAVLATNGRDFSKINHVFHNSWESSIRWLEFSRHDADTFYIGISQTAWDRTEPAYDMISGTLVSPTGVYKTTDLGSSWEQVYAVPSGQYEPIRSSNIGQAFLEDTNSSRSDDLYFATYSNGIRRSLDGGATWSDLHPAISDRQVKSIQSVPGANPADTVIYAIVGKKMPVHSYAPGFKNPVNLIRNKSALPAAAAQWKLENSSAGAFKNSSVGVGQDLIFMPTVANPHQSLGDVVSAERLSSLKINGVDQYAAISGKNYSAAQSAVSVSAWVKTTDEYGAVVSFDDEHYWELSLKEGKARWEVYTNGGTVDLLGSEVVSDGDWHNIVACFEPGVMSVYVDGVLDATQTTGVGSTYGSGAMTRYGFIGVGSKASSENGAIRNLSPWYGGNLDDVRIFDAALTEENARYIYLYDEEHKNYIPEGQLWRFTISGGAAATVAVERLHTGLDDFAGITISPADPSSGLFIRHGVNHTNYVGGKWIQEFSNYGSSLGAVIADQDDLKGDVGSPWSSYKSVEYTDSLATKAIVVTTGGGMKHNLMRLEKSGGSWTWYDKDRDLDGNGYVGSVVSWYPRDYKDYEEGQGLNVGKNGSGGGDILVVDPNLNGVAYTHVAFHGGVLRTEDHGATWRTWGSGGPNKDMGQLDVCFANPAYMASGGAEYGVVVTKNSGAYWEGHTYDNDPTLGDVTDASSQSQGGGNGFTEHRYNGGIAYKPDDPLRMVATYTKLGRILTSSDSGGNWTDTGVDSSINFEKTSVHWSHADTEVVYAGKMRSSDAGLNWIDTGKLVMAVSASNPDVIVGVDLLHKADDSAWDLHFSTDGGSSWVTLPSPAKEANYNYADTSYNVVSFRKTFNTQAPDALAIDPRASRDPTLDASNRLRLLLAGRGGIYEFNASSNDATSGTWTVVNEDIAPNIHHLADFGVGQEDAETRWMGFVTFDPRPSYEHVVYASKTNDFDTLSQWTTEWNSNHTYPAGDNHYPFYRSLDSGASWEALHGPVFEGDPIALMVHDIEVGPSGDFYALSTEGIFHLQNDSPSDLPTAVSVEGFAAWEGYGEGAMTVASNGMWNGALDRFEVSTEDQSLELSSTHSWARLVYNQPFSAVDDTYTVESVFSFAANASAPSSSKSLIRLEITDSDLGSLPGSSPQLSLVLKRLSSGSYQLGLWDKANSTGANQTVSAAFVGLGSGTVSDKLRLRLKIRHIGGNVWDMDGELHNLDTRSILSVQKGGLSQVASLRTNAHAALNSCDLESGANVSSRVIDSFKVASTASGVSVLQEFTTSEGYQTGWMAGANNGLWVSNGLGSFYIDTTNGGDMTLPVGSAAWKRLIFDQPRPSTLSSHTAEIEFTFDAASSQPSSVRNLIRLEFTDSNSIAGGATQLAAVLARLPGGGYRLSTWDQANSIYSTQTINASDLGLNDSQASSSDLLKLGVSIEHVGGNQWNLVASLENMNSSFVASVSEQNLLQSASLAETPYVVMNSVEPETSSNCSNRSVKRFELNSN